MGEALRLDPLLRLAQHRLADVDPDQPVVARVIRERNPGADPDLENAAADPFRRLDCRRPALREHGPEHDVIDRRPAGIGLFEFSLIEWVLAATPRTTVPYTGVSCTAVPYAA